ncbi:Spc7 kinetochore protein-domain-containing protein [Gilbertella persicaria]|uniref:Spc7 kinetochore protein-domain-containing protein n=1 Tax=Gilbertella persicaria TaxID=101096 RepID=UPI002220E629|nr:Spc7 kinetochore protein-domain-containing protein [Gilbertella persicaria]KAI8087693.1 Spc7 kinetochore protein-domain-containing protein [Gilbertella persicaria]
MLMSDVFGSSPLFNHQDTKSPVSRIIGSPLDQRKRRPDLFGSPPSSTRSIRQRTGGHPPSLLQRMYEDDHEDETNVTVSNQGESDLMQYLGLQHQQVSRGLFDEEEEEEEEEQNKLEKPSQEDMTTDSMMITQVIKPPKVEKRASAPSDDQMEVVEEYDVPLAPEGDDDSMQITQEISSFHREPSITFSPLRPSLPQDSPSASPMRSRSSSISYSPFRPPSISNHSLRSQSMPYSPLRPSSTALTASPSKAFSAKSPSSAYSPSKSFYLHDKSPSLHSRRSLSVESDHVFSHDNNTNLLEEEFSGLYDSSIDNTVVDTNISLLDFLRYVGIDFPEPVVPKLSIRETDFDADDKSTSEAQQAIAYTCILPQLEFFESAIVQINSLIERSKEKIEGIEQDINQANPQFFSEFREGSVELRLTMERRFEKLKEYARLKATIAWLEWFSNTWTPLIDTLEEHRNSLEKDQESIRQFEDIIRERVADIGAYHTELLRVLKELQEKEIKHNSLDSKRLKKLQEEIEQQRNTMQSYEKQIATLESEEHELEEKTVSLNEQKQYLLESIENSNVTLREHPYVTEKEFVAAADTYNRCIEIHDYQLEQHNDRIMQFSMSGGIHITCDRIQLQNRGEKAVLIQLLDSRERELGPLAELVHGLKIVVRNKWDINEITQDIAIYWNRVGMMQYELKELQRRFWVKIEALEFASLVDDSGFSCEICMTSFIGKAKFTVAFQVKPKDVLNYPALDLNTLEVKLHYGDITQEGLESSLTKAIGETGFTSLVDTLRDILDQISIPKK